MATTQELYDELVSHLTGTALLGSCSAVLGWDEQTYLPTGGAEHRANQLSLLAGMVHERATSSRVGELLSELEDSAGCEEDSPQAVNVREARHDYDRATKLPRRLVEEISRVTSLAQQHWVAARKKADAAEFIPWLEQVVALKREEAEAIGYGDGVPYDALLDQYEPGASTADVEAIFTPLREELVSLVAAIKESGVRTDSTIITRRYPIDAQREFGIEAATQIGFDFEQGRLDEAAHPFCSGFGPGDCRLTTRYDERHFPGAFFGTLHEAGHGMYEQGLDTSAYGTPLGESASLGIHESQSRMWENFVGRSRAFWTHFYPLAQQAFAEALDDVAVEDFYRAVNDVQPSFIRVEADEVTYNLHIMLRFELEQQLVSGDLKPADVPGVWNETFARYFDLTPPNDALGCLQDIHWSGGGIGYFPTYALGNMFAAQFFEQARQDLGDLDEQFARGEFTPLREWLNEHIHRRGKTYRANRLVEVVTGEPLSHKPLVRHLHAKFNELYNL
jgi:carboxypeptidase Taq